MVLGCHSGFEVHKVSFPHHTFDSDVTRQINNKSTSAPPAFHKHFPTHTHTHTLTDSLAFTDTDGKTLNFHRHDVAD